ncbi:HIRAN domain-containing protein [Zoogloea sp. 1C4]|uniref:HIRAN domain-containing protein n=1 Tax=Zoogloea sp. 1C4 TaxID=2570190 RepID=UPI001290B39C|nr:HIRAN domain-containing protein [Zoogloea sp. 1C4]
MLREILCTAILACALAAPASAQQMRILVQSSPLAGFQYYGGKILWDEMREGDRLALVREPDNRHDPFAVRVEWRGAKLGYLPRSDNRDVAEEMDRGTPIAGRIGRLTTDRNPWKRLRVDVYVGL